MKKLGISFVFVFLFMTFVQAQKCDCTITPFEPKPKCFDECTTQLLGKLKPIEFELIFGLKTSSAEKVATWSNRGQAKTLEDYMAVLTADEVGDLMKKSDSFNKQQLEYLSKPTSERDNLRVNNKNFTDLFAMKDKQGSRPDPPE